MPLELQGADNKSIKPSAFSFIKVIICDKGAWFLPHSVAPLSLAFGYPTVTEDLASMSATNTGRPDPNEYDPYYERYICLVHGQEIISELGQQLSETLALLRSVSEAKAEMRYAPGKWSLKEVGGHVLDFERIFGYRALLIARGELTPLPGCDQDELMRVAEFSRYRLSDLAAEFEQVRRANISFFEHLGEEAWDRRGVASEVEVSVRALAYIMAGHEAHHRRVIREKYL